MKTVLAFTIIIVLAFTFSASAQNLSEQYNVDDSKIALQGYSAVSYIDHGLAQRGLKEFKSVLDGISYYFTSAEQKAKFDRNPRKYLPQYGGYCAFGVAVGARFRVDPHKFLVRDGKLFLFLYNLEVDAQQLWLEGDEEELIRKADANWQKLSKS